ncbi:HalOD1 output domain-containing protein [Haladaptatus sp. NG-SE-30]
MTKATDGDDTGVSEESEWNLVQQAQYDQDGRHDLTTTIISAIADAEGVSLTEVDKPILYECVDVTALEDAFFGPYVEGHSRDSVSTAEFEYGDYRVVIKSDGWISVYERS